MEWKIKVPIFKNPVIVKQLGIAIGIPFGIVAVVIGVSSGRRVHLRWSRITKISCRPNSQTILLRGGWTEQIALFCTKENYAFIEAFVRQKCLHAK